MNKNTSLVKRVLCAWVSLCMVLTLMVPAPVFATASHAEGVGEQSAQPVQTEDACNKDKGSVPEDAVSEDATPAPEDAAPAQEDAAQVQEDSEAANGEANTDSSNELPEVAELVQNTENEATSPQEEPIPAQADVVFDEKNTTTVTTADQLVNAVADAPGGATILLGADIALDEALWVFGMGSLTINLCSHELSRHLDQTALHGSVIEVGNETTLTICDNIRAEGKITGGKTFRGGAIYNLGTLNIIGGELSGNTAVDGGAIWNAGVVHMTNCYLLHNEARRSGGAIANVGGGEVVAIGCRINNNVVQSDYDPLEYEYEGNGGGVLNEGVMTLRDCTIQQNSATYGGGVANRFDNDAHVANNKDATVLISNCDISENTATKQGAGVCALNGLYEPSDTKPSVTIGKSTRILRNTVDGYGGGLYVSKDCTVLFKDSTIAENETGRAGGGIHCEGTLQMSGSPVVKDNTRSQTLENIYMTYGKTIHIVGEFKSGAYVSWPVSRFEAQQVITTGYGDFNGDADAAQYFYPYGESNFYYGHTVYTRSNEAMVGANMPYLDETGAEQVCYNYVVVTGNSQKTMSEGWYYVYGELNLSDRAEVLGGHARIILGGNCTATYSKGITVEDGATLSIYRQPELEGKLIAKGEENCAGIGSTRNKMPGNVNIYGGVIEATGGRFGAGIGGGINYRGFSTTTQPNATLHIFGGTVTARGGEFASGIGGGQRMSNPHIVIDGGTIEAHGGSQGTGIGAGANGPVFRSIEINGGDVTAVGGGGAGIGAGYNCEPLMNPSVYGPIILRGGTIKASSINSNDAGIRKGAGIGGGAYERQIGSSYVHRGDTFTGAGIVDLCGAVVEATGTSGAGDCNASAVGSGSVSTKQLKIRLNYDSAKPNESMDYMAFDRNGKKLLAKERVAACRDTDFVRLEPCDHAEQEIATAEDGAKIASCKYCGRVGEVFTIAFEPDEGKGAAFTRVVPHEIDYELPDGSVFESPDGVKKLVGWKIGDELYAPKAKIHITQDCTAVAQWTTTWASLQQYINESTGKAWIYLSNDVVATEQDTTLVVPTGKDVMLFMEGHSINRNVTEPCVDGTVIRVEGSLDVRDHSDTQNGCIAGGNSTQNAGGVYVANGGYLRLFGAHVSQNYAAKGGGVYVERGGSFDLTAGSVHTNFAKTGGGIYLEGGTCTLTGGDVVDNRATDTHGGGIFVNGGDLQMTRGEIVDNAANKWGAGVMVQSGTFAASLGYIQRNAAGAYGGGIYVSKGATCSLSGFLHVDGNRAGKTAGAGNVYLATGAFITIPSTLDPYEPIGVTTQTRPRVDAPVVLTSGFQDGRADNCFVSESSAYAVGTSDQGEAVIGISQTVSFDAGEGSGDMDGVAVVSGSDYVLPKCDFQAPDGHEFAGWKVAGESDVRAAGSHMVISRNVTLFATWTKNYDLWVAGVRVTSANAGNILGDGTARFDEETATLVLNGFHAQGTTYAGAMIRATDMDLTVTGDGVVEGESRGIFVDGGTLTLGGNFTIRGQVRPVQATRSTITFTDGSFTITGSGYRAAIGITASEAVVKNGVKRLQIDADRPMGSALLTLDEGMEVKIPKHAHVENGIIRDAQDNEPSLQVVIAPAVRPVFRTHSLSLDGKIGVRFFMELPTIEDVDWTQSHMDFSVGGKGAFQASDSFDAEDKNNAGTFYAFTCYVSSIQMAEPITATFHYAEDGVEKSVSQTYSVSQYFSDYESVADQYDQKVTNLVHALADYGHYVQLYLSAYHKWEIGTDYAEIKAVTNYTNQMVDEARVATEPYAIECNVPKDGEIKKVTMSLDLETDTSIYLRVHMSENASVTSAVRADGTTLETAKAKEGVWCIVVPNIMAYELGSVHDFDITTSGGTEASVRVSALSFASVLLHDDNEDDQNALFAMTSMYRYYEAAKAYPS